MRPFRHLGHLACLLFVAPACGGETLHVGEDERHATASSKVETRCAAPFEANVLRAESPAETLARGRSLLIGRWMGCQANPPSSSVPSAIEFVSTTEAYALRRTDDGYERTRSLAVQPGYSVIRAGYYLTVDGEVYDVAFDERLATMTWSFDSETRYRFVKE